MFVNKNKYLKKNYNLKNLPEKTSLIIQIFSL